MWEKWIKFLNRTFGLKQEPAPVAESRVVEAVGVSTRKKSELSKKLELAMSQGILNAIASGVKLDDRASIRAYQMKARARVLAEK